ncbi:hypothetical protein, partial [Paenibacillus elgii]|uniref:hypothetical protein n=1 Tax=Paenibacillus elgii TaxID=189691 RepID=UPI00203F531B
MKRLISQYLFLILGGAIILLGMVFAGINFLNHNPVNDRVMISVPGAKQVFLNYSGITSILCLFSSSRRYAKGSLLNLLRRILSLSRLFQRSLC